MKKLICLFVSCLVLTGFVNAKEPSDEFSRAGCINNESITYNYIDPPEWRFVSGHHFKDGRRQHYVTPNPTVPGSCTPGVFGVNKVNGLNCLFYATEDRRHAAIHGSWAPTEPHSDGNLYFVSNWRVVGYHAVLIPNIGYVTVSTSASGCNLHFEQFY